MFCLLNDVVSWDQYALACLHYTAVVALVFGVYKLVQERRAAA